MELLLQILWIRKTIAVDFKQFLEEKTFIRFDSWDSWD